MTTKPRPWWGRCETETRGRQSNLAWSPHWDGGKFFSSVMGDVVLLAAMLSLSRAGTPAVSATMAAEARTGVAGCRAAEAAASSAWAAKACPAGTGEPAASAARAA